MKNFYLLVFALLFVPAIGFSQGIRYDSNVTTSAKNVPVGAQANVMTLPYAKVTICGYPATGDPCTNTATIFSDPGLTTPITQPITSDSQGRYGFWVAGALYSYSVQTAGGANVGTFPLSLNSPPGPQGPGGIGCATGNCVVSNPTGPPFINGPISTTSLSIPDREIDCAEFSTIDACFAAAITYANANESGGGHAIRVLLHDKNYTVQSPPLPLVSGMTIVGVAPRVTASPSGSWFVGTVPNGGTWINCSVGTCMGATGNGLTGYANINIRDVGFTNWGAAMVTIGSPTTQGLVFGSFRDIYGIGQATAPASDRGFDLHNTQLIDMEQINIENVNTGLYWANDLPVSSNVDGGNSVISAFYTLAYTHSVANGNSGKPVYWLRGPNFLTFWRPQYFMIGGDSTGDGFLIDGTLASFHTGDALNAGNTNITLHDADLEGLMLNAVHIVNAAGNHVNLQFVSGANNAVFLDPTAEYNTLDNAGGNAATTSFLSPTPLSPEMAFTNIFDGFWTFQQAPQGGVTPIPGHGLYFVPGIPGTGGAGSSIATDNGFIFNLTVGGDSSFPTMPNLDDSANAASTHWARSTIGMPLYDSGGTLEIASHQVWYHGTLDSMGSLTLTLSGVAVFTNLLGACSANDASTAAPVKVLLVNLTTIQFTGTPNDSIEGVCAGN